MILGIKCFFEKKISKKKFSKKKISKKNFKNFFFKIFFSLKYCYLALFYLFFDADSEFSLKNQPPNVEKPSKIAKNPLKIA